MRLATQQDVDAFMAKAMFDESVYPYLSTSTYNSPIKVTDGDWNDLVLTNDNLTVVLVVDISRAKENSLDVCLWSTNSFAAGRALEVIDDLIKRYNPKSITSCVHESNERSLKLNRRLYGPEWGVEPEGAWNALTGKWEGLVKFKRIFR